MAQGLGFKVADLGSRIKGLGFFHKMMFAGAKSTQVARPAYAYMSCPRCRSTQILTFAGLGFSTPPPLARVAYSYFLGACSGKQMRGRKYASIMCGAQAQETQAARQQQALMRKTKHQYDRRSSLEYLLECCRPLKV